jgi:hypothetical protein
MKALIGIPDEFALADGQSVVALNEASAMACVIWAPQRRSQHFKSRCFIVRQRSEEKLCE